MMLYALLILGAAVSGDALRRNGVTMSVGGKKKVHLLYYCRIPYILHML